MTFKLFFMPPQKIAEGRALRWARGRDRSINFLWWQAKSCRENRMKPGRKKAGHFQIQPSKRAAGEARLVGKRPNCFTGLDWVTGYPPGLSKFPGCPSRSCCTPLTPDSGGNGPHARLSSPLLSSLRFSLLPPCPPTPEENTK